MNTIIKKIKFVNLWQKGMMRLPWMFGDYVKKVKAEKAEKVEKKE